MKALNLPNRLTILRIIMVPVCMAAIVLCPVIPDTWSRILSSALFILTALTDTLDGMIARKRGLVTDFGKFLDPVADKLLIIGVFLAMLVRFREDLLFSICMMIVLMITITREIGVTTLRMVVNSKDNIVVSANWLGKLKTISQMIGIPVILLEPIVLPTAPYLGYAFLVIMTVLTVLSGLSYFKAYFPYINPKQ